MIFSAQDWGGAEVPLAPGRWFVGGHFWFRKTVLNGGRRFRDIWLTEPDFQLDLAEKGYQGLFCPNVVAGHRIQHELLKLETVTHRMREIGRCAALLRLNPYRKTVKQARLLRNHPLLGRVFCLVNHLCWRALSVIAFVQLSESNRLATRLLALERRVTYLELFRLSNLLEEYSIS